MKKYVHISVPIYEAWVYVVSDVQECIRLSACRTGTWLSEDDFHAKGLTINRSAGANIIWLPEEAGIDTIAHECLHAVLNIFHGRGIAVDTTNQEPTAYLIGWLTDRVVKAHNKLKESANGQNT